jgi:hypothetical protein
MWCMIRHTSLIRLSVVATTMQSHLYPLNTSATTLSSSLLSSRLIQRSCGCRQRTKCLHVSTQYSTVLGRAVTGCTPPMRWKRAPFAQISPLVLYHLASGSLTLAHPKCNDLLSVAKRVSWRFDHVACSRVLRFVLLWDMDPRWQCRAM